MKKISISLLLLIFVACIAIAGISGIKKEKKLCSSTDIHSNTSRYFSGKADKILKSKAKEASLFAAKQGYNTDYCFLVNLSLPSGHNRFFVYDLTHDSLLHAGLVTHGNCNQEWLEGRKYDNKPGCGCSSPGKYKVGYAYTGRFGLAFKLYGLEKTNSNAFARYVVLHSHSCVPASEVSYEICQSNGCPTVSPAFLKVLEPLIKGSKKPILLWIYNE